MKRNKAAILLTSIILGTGPLSAQADEKKAEPKKQTVCPVMGGKINKAQYVDVQGKRIYVCCPGCIGKIKADPDKYIKQMETEGIELENAPKQKEHAGHKHDHDHDHDHGTHKH